MTAPEASPFISPTASVADPALARRLAEGRPAGDAGEIVVDGVHCPTITARGEGRPILFVHGLGHDAWDWTPLFAQCNKRGTKGGAPCVALDLPGFGLAGKQRPVQEGKARAHDMRVLTDAVLAAATNACDAPPIVVASSLGGHAAILAALEEPEIFHKLVLLAPGGLVEVPTLLQATLRGYYAVDAIATRPEAEIIENSRRIFVDRAHALCEPLVQRKLAVRRSPAAREFAVPFAGIVDDVFRHVVLDRFATLRVPTLVAVGAGDVVVPPDACALAARRLGCQFIRFENVGHAPHLEAPAACADAVLSFAGAT